MKRKNPFRGARRIDQASRTNFVRLYANAGMGLHWASSPASCAYQQKGHTALGVNLDLARYCRYSPPRSF